MTKVSVWVEIETYSVGGQDPDDSWSRDSTDGYVTGMFARVADDSAREYTWGDDWTSELDVKAGDSVYAVIAQYSTGDTFGNDGCQIQILDVFADEDTADELAIAAGGESTYSFNFNGKDYYRAYTGYFESLQILDVYQLTVQRRKK